MARKKSTTKASPSEQTDILLSADEVWNVVKFAQELYKGQGVFNPMLINQAMQSLTMNPQQATLEKIDQALLDPKNNEQQLIGYSEFEELTSMIYKRVLYYFGGLLEFNWTYTCVNAEGGDYKSKGYKRDLKEIEIFFDKFNPKQEFRSVIKQLMRQEAYFGVFRNDGTYRHTIQELPQQRCLITGRWELGILFDFDMMFFNQAGTDINMYPPIFKKFYNRAFGNNQNINSYNPANGVFNRDGSWTYYVQTSPEDNFWCFKLVSEITTRVPFLSPYLKDVVLQDLIRALQTDSYIANASKLLVGSVPFLKDTKASVKDSIALAPETLAKFLQLMKSGLSNAIKVVAAPLENISGVEFKGDSTLYDSYLKTTASGAGINSRLIYSYDRQNILETKLSMDIDMNVLRPVLTQMENFLEFFANKNTKKFKFKFHLTGFNTALDREERLTSAKTYAENGMVMDQQWASAIGMSPFDFRRQMEETRENGFVEKLTPIIKASQMPAEKTGAPKKPDGSLSDSGSNSRESGSNEEKGEGG